MIGQTLSFSLGQLSLNSLEFKNLQDDLSRAGERNVSGQNVQKYSQMGADAWSLLGAQAAQLNASHLSDFCAAQTPVVEMYQAQLQCLENELTQAASDLMTAATTWDLEGNLTSFQKNMAEHATTIMNALNTFNDGRGYFFAGAQTDLKPVHSQLALDLCQSGGPNMTLGDIKNYFLAGPYADAQLPLSLFYEDTGALSFPVCANDLQSAFQTFLDVLSLTPENAAQGVRQIQGGFDAALYTLKRGILDTSTLLNAFEDKAHEVSTVRAASADQVDILLKTDPIVASMELYQSQKALESFMQFTMMMLAFEKTLREMAASI